MNQQRTPLSAAKQWAATHPDMDARVLVKRYGTASTLVTEYFASGGKVGTWRNSGVCRVCGKVIFGACLFGTGRCATCETAGLDDWNYLASEARRTVQIDLRKDVPTVKEQVQGVTA